jgi:chemotaxis protein MotB
VVEGHTDNVSVGSALKNRFPSNWELATARAAAVVRFLHEAAGLEPERLSATGYSYFKPIASNDTEEGRSQNRRIEVILVPIR